LSAVSILTDGVVTTRVVVRRILLTRDELLRVKELTVGTSTNLIDHSLKNDMQER
jgi:hypothetical protein